jgi:hypothetical protein
MIAAKVFGFKTGDITVELTDLHGGYRGGAKIFLSRPLRNLDEVTGCLGDRTVVLWAGAVAESLKDQKADQTAACACLKSEAGRQDHAKATELLNLLRNLRFPDAQSKEESQAGLTAIEHEIWEQTVAVVEVEEALIVGMAEGIARMVKLTAKQYTLSEAEIAATPNIIKRFAPK